MKLILFTITGLGFRVNQQAGSHQLAGGGSQVEVFRSEAARIVGNQRKPDPVIANVYVWMMAGFFCQLAHLVYEGQ
jgi:hypothetical protein